MVRRKTYCGICVSTQIVEPANSHCTMLLRWREGKEISTMILIEDVSTLITALEV